MRRARMAGLVGHRELYLLSSCLCRHFDICVTCALFGVFEIIPSFGEERRDREDRVEEFGISRVATVKL